MTYPPIYVIGWVSAVFVLGLVLSYLIVRKWKKRNISFARYGLMFAITIGGAVLAKFIAIKLVNNETISNLLGLMAGVALISILDTATNKEHE